MLNTVSSSLITVNILKLKIFKFQLVKVLSRRPKGRKFDSWSGHTHPACGLDPRSGRIGEGNQSMFLSLSSSLSKSNEKMSLDEDEK